MTKDMITGKITPLLISFTIPLVILFVSGLCMGAGVLISMQYGAKDYDKLCLQLSSTLIGGLVFSAAVAIVSVIAAPALLRTALPVPDH